MAEIFVHSGSPIAGIGVPGPDLQGIFISEIDVPDSGDGFGLVVPFGGGATARRYKGYGVSAEGSTQRTQLNDLSIQGNIGGDVSYNFEGLVGPQGPAGPPGPPGATGIIGLPAYNSNFLTALPDNLDKINDLGTAADQLIYTSAYIPSQNDIWTEFQPTGAEDIDWQAIATDSDGSVIIIAGRTLVGNIGKVYLSTDSGASFSDTGLGGDATYSWKDVACDSNGSHLLVVSLGIVSLSINSGLSFNDVTPPLAAGDYFSCGAMDADGSNLIVGEHNGRLWTSSDSGANWTERRYDGDKDRDYFSVASNSTGSQLISTDYFESSNPGLYISYDSGTSWTDKTPVGAYSQQWQRTAMDDDGSHILAINYDPAGSPKRRIFASSDNGTSWTEVDHPDAPGFKDFWSDVALDSDGSHQMMSNTTNGRLYTSLDGGTTWVRQDPSGTGILKWLRVATVSDGSIWMALSFNTTNRAYQSAFSVSYSSATWAESTITSAGRGFLDDVTQGDQQNTLGLGVGDAVTHDTLTLSSIAAEATDVDKFLVDSSGVIKYRTGDQVLSDIGASASSHLHDGATLQHDAVNSDGGAFNFATTGLVTFNQNIAAANYAAANLLTAAATNAGELDFTSASKKLDVEDNAVVSQDYSSDASPTWAGVTLTGLTDDSLIYPASGVLTSLGVASNGQIPIGSTGATPVLAGLTGTANRISVTNGAGSITLITPQDTHTGASNFTVAGATIGDIAIPGVYDADGEPTGFIDRVAVLSWDDASHTLTITGDHDIYCSGVLLSKSTDSIQIGDTTGVHIIYYDSGGTLSSSTVFPGWDNPLVATVYWNTDGGGGAYNKGLVGEERHSIHMDAGTHTVLHDTVGSRYSNGLSGTFDDTTISIATGLWYDEDLDYPVASPLTTCNVLYKNGSVDYEWDAGASVYYKLNGANLRYNNGNDLADAGNNQYIAMWVFITNEITTPIIALMGQRVDTTLKNARANNRFESLSLGNLPFKEMKLLYRVILRNTGTPPTFIETEDLRNISNLPGGTYVATAHNVLTGLTTGDDHTQYLLADGTRALSGAWDMGSQALTNVNIDSGVITGITDLAIADGGTGQSTAQLAINALSAVGAATNEHVLTKDTGTGNAIFKAATGAGGSGDEYVDRGDPVNYDFTLGDFTTDATWRDLDLSAVVPAGAVLVLLACSLEDNASGSIMLWRKNGNTNNVARDGQRTQVQNAKIEDSVIVACDSNRVIEYYGTNTAFTAINVTIIGWWIPAGTSNGKVKVDVAATADYLGAAAGDGALRVGTGVSYADEGNFVTLGVAVNGLAEIGAALVDADTFIVDDGDSGTTKKCLMSRLSTYIGGAGTDEKVKIDAAATADYLGAANNDGALRTSGGLSYTDGGNFVTIGCFNPVDAGDPATADYDLTGFTTDGNWHDWNLSGEVPAGATWALLNVSWNTDASQQRIQIRKNGNSNAHNLSTIRTQVANVRIDYDVWVPVDANRVVEYNITNGTTFVGLNVATVKGWMLA
jgi:hypothetical protein